MTTIYVTHPRYTEHDMPGHVERADRVRAVWKWLDEAGLTARMQAVEATPADLEILRAVHTPAYLELLKQTAAYDRLVRLDADTYVTPTSYEIALLAAGGVVDAVRTVVTGEADNGLAAVRPPGHHTMPDRAMGFCLIGNIAAAARYAQQAHHIERVLIVDYDVHHGNGTEAMFYPDPSVLFISIHQWPLYPGTGAVTDTGSGPGKGYTINIPVSAGSGDASYKLIFEQVIWPAAVRFEPELILVSVGHDAHWLDPLAGIELTLTGYAQLAREMMLMAKQLCGGKIVFVMEGGYDLDVLSYGMVNIAHALLGDEETVDPLGQPPGGAHEPDIAPLIERVQRIHNLSTPVK
jgi:acetoin utilization deacetylase AcuC-like enzyme